MFPSTHTGLRARLRDKIDLLVDFATLGEYRLAASSWPEPEEAGDGDAARLVLGGGRAAPAPDAPSIEQFSDSLRPSTAAARRRRPLRQPGHAPARPQPGTALPLPCAPVTRRPVRPGAASGRSSAQRARRPRARSGSAAPAPVPCVGRG